MAERISSYEVLVTGGLQRTFRGLSDHAVGRALAEECGVTITTPEASAALRQLVGRLRSQYTRGALQKMSAAGLELHLMEVVAALAPVEEGPRYQAALGLALPVCSHVPLAVDRLGLQCVDERPDVPVDVDACAWRWVAYVLLTAAYAFAQILCVGDVETG